MILDATFVIDVLRGDLAAHSILEASEAADLALHVPASVVFEVWEGVERAANSAKEASKVAAFLDRCQLLPLEPDHAMRAGRLAGQLGRKGIALDPLDLFVASVAVDRGEPVLTRNVKDFRRIPGVVVERY